MIETIFLLIPLFNEEKYINKLIESLIPELKRNPTIKEVLFIDDGSTDGTNDIINKNKRIIEYENIRENKSIFHILEHKTNMGKGAAMKTGLEYAKKQKAGGVIFMDGDMQHDPKHLSQFISKMSEYPVVFGHRQLPKEMPFLRKIGNTIANILLDQIFNISRKDVLCGYLGLRRDIFTKIYWESRGYGVETELAIEVYKSKIPYGEISISTIYFDPSKGLNFIQAFFILCTVPYWFFRRRNLE